MKIYLKLICGIIICFLSTQLFAQYPELKQATFIETVSPTEVLIQATGIYNSPLKGGLFRKEPEADVRENGVRLATIDAKKAAVYLILLGGTDPLISTPEERAKFEKNASFFFDMSNVSRYISWEETQILKKVKFDDGTGIKVTKRFKVNKEIITNDLVSQEILVAKADLVDIIGNPFIMVIPETKKGENPIELLQTNVKVKHAAAVVESYLTARKYDVIVPEQQVNLDELTEVQQMLGDHEEDYAYQLALSIGSDVYITFSGAVESTGYGTEKYSMNVRAYETTTARLLGAETGYSQARQGEIMVSIEEAMSDAINNVLSRIMNYWKDDLKRGMQYKLIVSISTDFDEDEVEDIQFAFMDAVDEVANKSKENIVTNQTIDYLLWCDPEKYDRSSKVYRYLKTSFNDRGVEGILKKINVNRKLILLKVIYE
ncbi:MAG: DUF6175 family protein [Candidatus Cloacimonadota bacterium]|nr:DUF6175 family protein [Candidatus Cloacimonadota bacterium]